jgi:hypothetical protein
LVFGVEDRKNRKLGGIEVIFSEKGNWIPSGKSQKIHIRKAL